MEKTKYRAISNGYWDYLQYEKEVTPSKILGIFKRGSYKQWNYVWKPYYDSIWGRDIVSYPDDYTHVSSLRSNLEDFVKKWPYIEDYFKWAEEVQKRLVKEEKEKQRKVREKENTVKYL